MTTDHVQEVAWDLDPLVDGDGPAGRRPAARRGRRARRALRRGPRGPRRRARRRRAWPRRWPSSRRSSTSSAAPGSYASLRFAVDTADPANGALLARVQERGTRGRDASCCSSSSSGPRCDDERADELLSADGLETTRHHLRTLRRYRPHLLSEPEEKAPHREGAHRPRRVDAPVHRAHERDPRRSSTTPTRACRSTSRSAAWSRPTARCAAPRPRRSPRRCEPGLRTRALRLQHAAAGQGRRRPPALATRPGSPAATSPTRPATSPCRRCSRRCARNYDLPQRWYSPQGAPARHRPARRLRPHGLGRRRRRRRSTGPRPRELVLDSFDEFSPVARRPRPALLRRALDRRPRAPGQARRRLLRLHDAQRAPLRDAQLHRPRRDVLALAHELGHGLHAALAIPRGPLEQHTPLTVCETASVFGETLVFRRLLDAADTPRSRLALLAENIEGSIATVFRQTAMNGFEALVHTARREEGELSVERFGELWEQSQVELLGDAVEITDGYRLWWSYVPHFIGTPGYVYAYAYGQLLALSVYRRYLEEGEGFVPALPRAAGAPAARAAPRSWPRSPGSTSRTRRSGPQGLDLVRDQLEPAEAAAAEVRAGGLSLSRRRGARGSRARRRGRPRSPRRRSCGRCARRPRAGVGHARRRSPRRPATEQVRSWRPASTSTGWVTSARRSSTSIAAVALGRGARAARRARRPRRPCAARRSSMRGSRGSAKWNGSWSESSARDVLLRARLRPRAAHDRCTCSRSSTGSKAASSSSTCARKRARGMPLETIVAAGRPGKSTACCSAMNAPKEWPEDGVALEPERAGQRLDVGGVVRRAPRSPAATGSERPGAALVDEQQPAASPSASR